jgi:hypothetical protein
MQPALIRVIDTLRKHIETTDWQSRYLEQVLWPASATAAEKQQVEEIAASLETAPPDQADQLRQQLSTLPAPLPGYQLEITHSGHRVVLDIWQLCFQVCFVDYAAGVPVRVDQALLDNQDDIDWVTLDAKARQQVALALQQVTQPNAG